MTPIEPARITFLHGTLLPAALFILLGAAPGAADVIGEWNGRAATMSVAGAAGLAPVQQTRAMAIVQVAMHDAVNAISREYRTYAAHGAPPASASPEAAAVAAAHHALRSLFPSNAALLDGWFAESLAAHTLSEADPGVAFGRAVAARILAMRTGDGAAAAQFAYVPENPGPGVWQPLPGQTSLLPGWGRVTPWILTSGSQFRPEPPPLLTSERYARDFNEVFVVGASPVWARTLEQTEIAVFWRASPVTIWNPVLQQVLAWQQPSLSGRARASALVYLAAADASIACWDAKYTYNFWRPFPAIVGGDTDGNGATTGDPSWRPFFGTPPHPEYPSGHTCNSGAMAATLALLFGDAPGGEISVTVFDGPTSTEVTRRWLTLGAGVSEVIDARVYSGIHFRTADEVGARLGRQVARFVVTQALRPCNGRQCS